MKKINKLFLSFGFIGVLSLSIFGCNKNQDTGFELRNVTVKRFVNSISEQEMCYLLTHMPGTLDEQSNGINVVEDEDEIFGQYEIEFSLTEDYQKSFKLYSRRNKIETRGLIPGKKYYYRINKYDYPDIYIKSGVLETKSGPGTFYTVEGMHNVRDLGGWKAENGKKINFDKIIRGGRTNAFEDYPYYTDEGYDVLTKSLGIKGEIDLRNSGDNYGQTHNFINEEYPYLLAPLSIDAEILPDFKQTEPVARRFNSNMPSTIKSIFSFLADETNYPVYVHCNAGADRTGTICMVIEGLLGVSVNDIYKEFELTSFSTYGQRWRSSIDAETMTFDPSGVMQDDNNNYVALGKCVNMLWNTYAPNGTYQEAVTNYLKSVCNVTDEEINSFKNIMLG